ncbi:uncharacterized protein LOC115874300 [Sitophilus oryzae]|uniref:Uncharacterized protein LOC115874300 n=1 Tax=Sitophilus oryzae TaxID=7048 RepID=A0A6J2X2A8_SITOR|nr:uncharacterized protein LOC115874300 [Sitophilus oryzae]
MKSAQTLGEKQHLVSCLGQIKSLRCRLKYCQKKGKGIQAADKKPRKETPNRRVQWEDLQAAFGSRIRTGVITNIKHIDPTKFLEDCAVLFKRRIQNALKQESSLKINTVLCGEFHMKKNDEIVIETKYLNTKNTAVYRDMNLDVWFKKHVLDPLLTDLDEFQERDSGWALSKVINLTININQYNPLRAGTYIDLPKQIKLKRACINVQNTDNMCFAWAVLSCLYSAPSNVADRTSSYPDPKKVLNLKGIQFPMTLGQVPRFEKQNNVSVNVYRLEKNKNTFTVIPTFLTKNKLEKHANLLMIQDNYHEDDANDIPPVNIHYLWIKNLSRLLSSQINREHRKKNICDRCLHYYRTEDKLTAHLNDCVKLNKGGTVPRIPTNEKKLLGFKNFNFKEKAPFVIYADTECFLMPIEDNLRKNTKKYQHHEPYSIGYYVKCSYDDSLSFYKSYTGLDCMKWFVQELEDFAENVETVFLCDLPMDSMTLQQTNAFYKAKICHICEKPFAYDNKKVRDHCHLTGKYRGPAHENCNLNYKDTNTVPVIFHNLSSYDGHIVVKALAETTGKISVLPVNKEKYISFTKKILENSVEFRFIDSFRFLASSLDNLVSNLSEYPILKSEFKEVSEEQFSLLCCKGIFPYDFMDGWSKLECNKLPEKQHFYNLLTDEYLSHKNYNHAQAVWNSFGCKTMRDYSNLYLKTDILLLADVFEAFRLTAHKTYSLDPAHTYTLPGYAWQIMLYQMSKTAQQHLELLTDLDMVLFIEKGIRGGLSQCSKRYAEANNKYMNNYNSSKEETYLMYFDINNQYGWAMSQYLPYGGFKWLSSLQNFNSLDIPDDADTGYILEVDLEIPHELHDIFSDLPPCPEHTKPPGSKNSKLLATLYNKKEYVIHYRNLKQALVLGVKLTKIHRILSFNQSPWLKSYIDLNTVLRQKAKNDFEKNLFKLMNNAVFGKTMENIRKHSTVKLITQWDGRYGAEALISRPEFKSSVIINENLVIIELAKSEVFFNKPIYVGMSILDIAKITIYDFHYNYMLEKFPNNCAAIYTDTDSLVYEIKNQDVYEIIKRDCSKYFDTSDYSIDNIFGIPQVNKKILGMMKDENNGRIMTHFIGLRSKMYATKLYYLPEELKQKENELKRKGEEKKEIDNYLRNLGVTKKIKGVKKCVIKKKITFNDYVECLENFNEKLISQNLIQSNKHELYSVKQSKISLSPHDDKRHLMKGSVQTLPHGHCSIMNI